MVHPGLWLPPRAATVRLALALRLRPHGTTQTPLNRVIAVNVRARRLYWRPTRNGSTKEVHSHVPESEFDRWDAAHRRAGGARDAGPRSGATPRRRRPRWRLP